VNRFFILSILSFFKGLRGPEKTRANLGDPMQILGLAMHYPVKLASVSAGDGTGHDSFGSHGGFHDTPKLMIYNL
jgi:hypothetical protein